MDDMMDPPWVFGMLQYISNRFYPLVESLRCALQVEYYIMSCGAAGNFLKTNKL